MKQLLLLALLLSAAGPVRAETHAVTIRNNGGETIRGIFFGGGDSRLRRELPQGAEARITYSTSCRTDIRIAYASGRTEDHPGVDVCSDPRIMAGSDGTPGPTMAPVAAKAGSDPKPVKEAGGKPAVTPIKEPPPVVPPWTGRSITKRFGGMD